MLKERYIRQGMSPADAAAAARRQFGNRVLLQEDRKEMRGLPSIENLWRSVRYGARQLRLNPGFTAVAVLSRCAQEREYPASVRDYNSR
jgi:hypothetical protein